MSRWKYIFFNFGYFLKLRHWCQVSTIVNNYKIIIIIKINSVCHNNQTREFCLKLNAL